MSVVPSAGNGKITVPSILERKSGVPSQNSSAAKITCLTAYDYPTARLLDEAGVDVLLVGDSLAMVALGYESTLPVTVEEMLLCTRAVRRGTRRALLVADMPYGSYHDDPAAAVRNRAAVAGISDQRKAPPGGRGAQHPARLRKQRRSEPQGEGDQRHRSPL